MFTSLKVYCFIRVVSTALLKYIDLLKIVQITMSNSSIEVTSWFYHLNTRHCANLNTSRKKNLVLQHLKLFNRSTKLY